MVKKLFWGIQNLLDKTRTIDFLAPLAIRLYLVPIFWMAGTNKLMNVESVAEWFGHPDWGLGLPFPTFFTYLAGITEAGGAILLLMGLGVRWVAIPLMIVMIVAALGVHWENGWLAIAHSSSEGATRLANFLNWLKEVHPERYAHITEHGKPVLLNNGVEFAVTYFIMLLTLFFYGAGKYFSIDYWLARKFKK